MTASAKIHDQEKFINNATSFFNTVFESVLNSGYGDIEIRTFPQNQAPQQFFLKSESEAAQTAFQLCNAGIDVYLGVNPRTGGAGKKENIHYLSAFHAEVDYGKDGHRKKEIHQTYLTLQNGLFDLNDYKLVDHNPGIFTTNLLPYDYNPEAECPRFIRYLNEIFMGDQETINCVQEAVGYTFYKSMPKPALFCLIGGGGNGKSVFIDTLTNLCGAENASSISLNLLSKEYYLLDLFGKMINVSSETPSKRLLNTDLLKAVTAGDQITARKPYEGPTKFKPFAKHFVAMNEAPVIEDSSHGMWRRLYIVNFPRRFKEHEMDVHLVDKLKSELSGIFNWALEGFRRLRARDFRFEESNSMKASKQDYKTKSNSALSFASEYLEKSSPDDSLRFKDVYELYETYSEKEGFKSRLKKNVFKKALQGAGFVIENSSRHNNDLRIFGVRLS